MALTSRARRPAAPPSDSDRVVEVLRRFRVIFNAVKRHFRVVEQKAGISGAHVWALSEVAARPGVAISDLARAMHVHQSTASNLVRMLMAAGLVSSERAGEDRRVVQLAVTPRGRKVLAKTPPPLTGLLPDALGRLDDSTLARMERDLGSLIAQLGADPRDGALLIGLGESRQARDAPAKRVAAAKRAPAAKTPRRRAA
jgi:DNA-binding MarR family transcriptional regulator